MPKTLKELPSLGAYYDGRVDEMVRKWIARRAIRSVDDGKLGTSIELADLPGNFHMPLGEDDLRLLAMTVFGREFLFGDQMARIGVLVCLDSGEAACFLAWARRKFNAGAGGKSCGRLADEGRVIDVVDLAAEEATQHGESLSVKDIAAIMEEGFGPRAGGWIEPVRDAIKKSRRFYRGKTGAEPPQ